MRVYDGLTKNMHEPDPLAFRSTAYELTAIRLMPNEDRY
jgi:hypothetical protein